MLGLASIIVSCYETMSHCWPQDIKMVSRTFENEDHERVNPPKNNDCSNYKHHFSLLYPYIDRSLDRDTKVRHYD